MGGKEPFFPLPSEGVYSRDGEATATCYCGAVQIAFPTEGEGLKGSFICNCSDCHKITASMFASNFIVDNNYMKHLRGEELLTKFAKTDTIKSGKTMTSFFCSTCGTLMYRRGLGFPGVSIPRIGTVDDFNLQETLLKPPIEQYVKDRACWLKGGEGAAQHQAAFYSGEDP